MSYHAQVRALERYGLQVGAADFKQIQEQITEGTAVKLGKRGLRTSIYKVAVQGNECVVVYNRAAKVVITFLPLDWKRK